MDASPLKPEREPGSSRKTRVVRVAIVWLATVLAVGLWQAYGEWLFAGGLEHAF